MPDDDYEDAARLIRDYYLLLLAGIVSVPVLGLLAWRWLTRKRRGHW
jgi:hypothetical protein